MSLRLALELGAERLSALVRYLARALLAVL